MKVEVYGVRERTERVLRLKLAQSRTDGVILSAVDEDGVVIMCGTILSINADGELVLHPNVNNSIGLSLDECGRVNVRKE